MRTTERSKLARVVVERVAFGQQRRDAIELLMVMMKMMMIVMVKVRC